MHADKDETARLLLDAFVPCIGITNRCKKEQSAMTRFYLQNGVVGMSIVGGDNSWWPSWKSLA
eukprot:scaffold13661_cov20-Prasinocladus_malaysianus.AAC.1